MPARTRCPSVFANHAIVIEPDPTQSVQGTTTSGVRGNANLRPTSSITLIWHVYRPGREILQRNLKLHRHRFRTRVPATCVSSSGPTSNALAPFSLNRLMLTLTRRAFAFCGSGRAS